MTKELDTSLNDLSARIEALEARNRRVDLDKKWEGSWQRKLSIAVLAYFVVFGFLNLIHNDKPYINALVPPIGFFLSTIVVKDLKKQWLKKQ